MSVTAAAGFLAAGVASGIKPDDRPDLAIVAAANLAIGAAVFTVNRAEAAPVTLSRSHLADGPAVRAVVLNSGCANAGTGQQGMVAARETAAAVADELGCAAEEVLVCSTGGIGMPLPLDRVLAGVTTAIPRLTSDASAATQDDGIIDGLVSLAGRATVKTQRVVKQSAISFLDRINSRGNSLLSSISSCF